MENQTEFKYIEVKAYKNEEVVKRINVSGHSEHSVDRIFSGLTRNMNHADFYSEVTTSETELKEF